MYLMILTYGLDLALINRYLEMIIKCLKPKLFNEIVEVLSYKILMSNETSIFSLNFLNNNFLIDCLIDRAIIRL